jgi:hypothetical protein
MTDFSDHLAHLESLKDLKVGDRIRVRISGRTGTICKPLRRHCGWMVEWDDPKFGVNQGRVSTANIEREES